MLLVFIILFVAVSIFTWWVKEVILIPVIVLLEMVNYIEGRLVSFRQYENNSH